MTEDTSKDDVEGRVEPPLAGDEIANLLGSLERQRNTFAWKCEGLDAEGMKARVGVSTITIGGLLKHMALVEAYTFFYKFLGESPGSPWDSIDWDADPDWEWKSAADDAPDELMGMWRDAVDRSRVLVDRAIEKEGLGVLSPSDGWKEPPNLRRLMVDMIEEYARHVGHADLIRETVDGRVGEDPPIGWRYS